MTKSQQHLANIVDALLAAGFVEDGETRSETVRVGTSASPVFGGSGGELRTFGGRARYRRGDVFVTVGPRTVFAWREGAEGRRTIGRFSTGDVTPAELLAALV